MLANVRSRTGVPVNSDFTSSDGTPAVVDINTGRAYVMRGDNTIIGLDGSLAVNSGDDITSVLAAAFLVLLGGAVLPPGTFHVSSQLNIPANFFLRGSGRGATTLLWTGANGSTQVLMSHDASGLEEMTIDTGSATTMTGVLLKDSLRSWMSRVKIVSATTANGVGLRLQGATSNCAYHDFYDVEVFKFQVGLQLDGIAAGPIVATDCVFYKLRLNQCALGIRGAQWCDTFDFYSTHIILAENGAIAVVLNDSATPAADAGVYNYNFYGIAFDAFGAIAGCTGFFINYSKQIQGYGFLHSPEVFPGTLINDTNAISYRIVNNQVNAANNGVQILSKGIYRGSIQVRDGSAPSYGVGPTDLGFPTETYDRYSCFASPTFTAPNTGIYTVALNLAHDTGVTPGDQWLFKIVSSARTYTWCYRVPAAVVASLSYCSSIDMNAGDTFKWTITRLSGAGNFPLFNDASLNFMTVEQVSDGQ